MKIINLRKILMEICEKSEIFINTADGSITIFNNEDKYLFELYRILKDFKEDKIGIYIYE